jgi:cyclic beta-1,2-glucan synthetase
VRVSGKRIVRMLLDLRARLGRTVLAKAHTDDEPPLRAELFSTEQMNRHAIKLADSHKLSSGRPSALLLTRLAENEEILIGSPGRGRKRRRRTGGTCWVLSYRYGTAATPAGHGGI